MFLEKILLKNYRNLKDVFLKLNSNLNIFIGANGQGKTNLLESIYLLGTADSHRTNVDSELINWNSNKSLIQVMLNKSEQDLKISLELDKSGKKAKINNNPLEKVSELIGNLNVVLFSPEDLQLVKGGPAKRRKFIDLEISQVSNYYYHLTTKYKHVLKQRNNQLKKIRDENGKKELLEVWDEQLVELGSKIIEKRLEVIEKIKILARLKQRQISDGDENLSMFYQSSLGKVKDNDIRLIFNNNLVNNRNKEIKRGYTLTGPHRDDIVLDINGIDLRKYGSQGQQRTAALALKLSELEFMKSETGEYPILLLDDVFSELDKQRRKTLIEVIVDKIQTFITSTEINNLGEIAGKSYQVFKVEKGRVKKGR